MFCNCLLFWISEQAFPLLCWSIHWVYLLWLYFRCIHHCWWLVFICDRAALRTLPSVCLSVCLSVSVSLSVCLCPSVCLFVCLSVTPFYYVPIIVSSWVIANDRSDIHARGEGQRSKVKVTEVKTHLSRFRAVTSVWIHIWWRNDAQSLMLLRRGTLLFFKVILQIARSRSF